MTVNHHVMPAGCHGEEGGQDRERTWGGSEVQIQWVWASCRGRQGRDSEASAQAKHSWQGGSCAPTGLDAAPGGSRVLQGRVGRSQDSCLSGFISCSTSRMNRRHSSSCQGRATHCTATGSPTLFLTACRGHRRQDSRCPGRAPPGPGKHPSWEGGAAQQGPPAVSRGPVLRKAARPAPV